MAELIRHAQQRCHEHALQGEYDLANAPDLALRLRRITNATRAGVMLDCADLRFWDSSAIAVLVETRERLSVAGRSMRLVNLHGGPRRVVEILGLTETFGV
jgi:anti-anti-sigma factor